VRGKAVRTLRAAAGRRVTLTTPALGRARLVLVDRARNTLGRAVDLR
jgi:hypothetical protein